MPQAWKDALNSAVQAGKIPSVPISSAPNNGTPAYPPGFDPTSDQVCSATYKCKIEGDIWDAPDGVIGVSFDDGPLPVSMYLPILTLLLRVSHPLTAAYIDYECHVATWSCPIINHVLAHFNNLSIPVCRRQTGCMTFVVRITKK
jgi:hypothetical protein